MNIDIKQVIQDLEHVKRSFAKEGLRFMEGYLKCINDLKDHPEIKKACAPQPGPKRTPEEIEKSKQPKVKEEVEDRGGVKCKFCNATGLKWKDRNADEEGEVDYKPSWCLVDMDTGKPHFCR